MLRQVKALHGAVLHAYDGEIGKVDEILFDDEHWTVRYLVIDTGNWLHSRKVLITPRSLGALNWDQRLLNVNLTRDQIKNSPSVDTNLPVSRQWETEYSDYYALPYYWNGMGYAGGMGYSGGIGLSSAMLIGAIDDGETRQTSKEPTEPHGDAHLRSANEVDGYHIVAQDGGLGHVSEFIVDDATWRISYLAVDTRDWWPGKHVLVPPNLIGQVLWPEGSVTVELTRDQVRSSPEWDPNESISLKFESQLTTYYAGLRVGSPAVHSQ